MAGAAVVATALSDTRSASSQQVSKGALVARWKTAFDNVVVDARGRTLYLLEKERQGRKACHSARAIDWPLRYRATPRAARGVGALLLGLTGWAGGRRQVTYAGYPLSTSGGDKSETVGECLGALAWPGMPSRQGGRAVEPIAADPSGFVGPNGGYGRYDSCR